jgi:hypothetical protein
MKLNKKINILPLLNTIVYSLLFYKLGYDPDKLLSELAKIIGRIISTNSSLTKYQLSI